MFKKPKTLYCEMVIDGFECKIPVKEHIRCKYCTRLLHGIEALRGYCCDPVEIQRNISDTCVICGFPLPGTIESFSERGNWCPNCNARADKNAKFDNKTKVKELI